MVIVSLIATPTAPTMVSADGDESKDNDELHNDEEEDEMLRITDAFTRIMV